MTIRESISKSRSPRYPRVSLETAIGYARRLYEEAHRSPVDSDTAFRLMGFSGKTGTSAVALGAVRQYGLVDGLRGVVKISDVALKILQPSSREEELEARHEAGFAPEAFTAILDQFAGELPRSDEAIKAYLIRTLNFSRAGAEECISSLRKTIVELEEFEGGAGIPVPKGAPETEHVERGETTSTPAAPAPLAVELQSAAQYELIRIPLTRECTAELRLVGRVSEPAIDKLIQYIELMKGVWAEQ